jgi:hypothetical protein
MHIYVVPNLTWIKDENINLGIKINEFNDSIESQILFKSKVFQGLP